MPLTSFMNSKLSVLSFSELIFTQPYEKRKLLTTLRQTQQCSIMGLTAWDYERKNKLNYSWHSKLSPTGTPDAYKSKISSNKNVRSRNHTTNNFTLVFVQFEWVPKKIDASGKPKRTVVIERVDSVSQISRCQISWIKYTSWENAIFYDTWPRFQIPLNGDVSAGYLKNRVLCRKWYYKYFRTSFSLQKYPIPAIDGISNGNSEWTLSDITDEWLKFFQFFRSLVYLPSQ